MKEPLVSIVVISYNQGKYIHDILDSLKNQTYKNWELILADDFSNDNSVAVFNSWLHENNVIAKKIYHQQNTGLATVLNEAIEFCTGKYIKLIAADDYMHPECFEKSVNFLQNKGERYGMVFTDTYAVDDKNNFIPDIADYNIIGGVSPEEFKKELVKGNRIAALTVLMRSDVLRETGKYDSTFIVEDYYRWLKISERYLIGYIPEKLSYYRLHEENISKTKAYRIAVESVMLQMMFDNEGIVKDKINNFTQTLYIRKQKIPEDFLKLYYRYKFRSKRLSMALKYDVPFLLYRLISKYI